MNNWNEGMKGSILFVFCFFLSILWYTVYESAPALPCERFISFQLFVSRCCLFVSAKTVALLLLGFFRLIYFFDFFRFNRLSYLDGLNAWTTIIQMQRDREKRNPYQDSDLTHGKLHYLTLRIYKRVFIAFNVW